MWLEINICNTNTQHGMKGFKILKLSSDSGDSRNKKCKRGDGGTYGGVWRNLRLAGVWSQAVGSVFMRLTGIFLQ
jgi:hypothetical protein